MIPAELGIQTARKINFLTRDSLPDGVWNQLSPGQQHLRKIIIALSAMLSTHYWEDPLSPVQRGQAIAVLDDLRLANLPFDPPYLFHDLLERTTSVLLISRNNEGSHAPTVKVQFCYTHQGFSDPKLNIYMNDGYVYNDLTLKHQILTGGSQVFLYPDPESYFRNLVWKMNRREFEASMQALEDYLSK